MNKFPFTEAGLIAANLYFYSLSEDDLWDQVYAVQRDFQKWILAHFAIEGEDLACLNSFNAHCCFVLGNQLSVTMSLRLPFRLERRPSPKDIAVFGAKRGKNHNPIGVVVTGADAPVGEGEFVYIIEA